MNRLMDAKQPVNFYMSISRLGEKALPLYQLMKKTTFFEWNDKADEAFLQLKRC